MTDEEFMNTDQGKANRIRTELAAPLEAICKILDRATLDGLMVTFNIAKDETNRNQSKVTVSKPL